MTVAIVGESTYPAIEIISPNEFYDFSAKYDGVGTKYIPANLSLTETKKPIGNMSQSIQIFRLFRMGKS